MTMTMEPVRQSQSLGSSRYAPEANGGQRYPSQSWQGDNQDSSTLMDGGQLSRALGWFSIGLGLAQIAAPQRVAQLIGLRGDRDQEMVLRAVGLRELASGIGILTQSRPAGWVKARVGGDVMDLALLGSALNSPRAQTDRVALALAAVAGITALDVLCSQQLSEQSWSDQRFGEQNERSGQTVRAIAPSVPHEQGIHVTKTITINRPAGEIYQFWRDFANLPRFMNHLESVHVADELHSYWRVKAPAGMTVGWDAEIIDDTPGERISWRSLEGADVPNAGSVRFKPAPGDRGTVVTVQIEYQPPGGALGAAIARLFGQEPAQQVQDDLRILKQVLETGDVVRSDATVHGPHLAQRPAQPPERAAIEGMQR